MRKWLFRGAAALLVLFLALFVALATWEPFFAESGHAPDEQRHYRAEILRSEFGVPHIYGKTDADVAFGVAIAHAEDDFFTLQDVLAMARGRYGAIAGEEGAQIDYAYHLLDARGTAERHYPALPEDTRALFEAYAAGLNQYAREHPQELKLANLFPVNGEDIAAGFALRQPFFFGLGGVIGPLVSGDPLRREFGPDIPGFPRDAESASSPAQTAQSRRFPLPWGEDGALSGSNAFAIAPRKSGDGVTRLVSNSHQPWRGGVAWYEMVVESEEGWHYAGANFPGSPYPFLGHNRHLGWTNTVNRPDMVDIYKLEMDDSGTRYRLDGEWRELESKAVTLPVKFGPIILPIRQTVYRSVHGPVIFNHTGVYALRYGGIDSVEQLDAYYRLNKATNLAEWQAQLARMAVPSTNFIYADEAGNIAYVYNAALPDRPKGANWRSVLPGDRSDLIWRGPVSYDRLPKLINPASGWLFNANNQPYSAAGPGSDLSPADFAPELGIELKTTNRAERAARLMANAPVIDRATLEAIKYDTGYERAGYVADLWSALEKLDLSKEADLGKARDLLLTWDFTADNRGKADAIALLMIKEFMSAEYQNKPLPDVKEHLRKQVDHLMAHFGRIDPPMSEVLRLRQGPGPHAVDLPLDGGSDTLRASTTWNVEPDGRLSVNHGDSFIQFVEWRPGERVRSQSIQPFGAATTRPGSKHYTDQAQLFVKKQLKPVHFWREDALANAERRYVVESN
ncbi:penicillin acylase family protein [Altererythrobacter sp. Z27]|uniref:penicillin acylase family protein n=1 Tax=Altererythrobacter sp. Z27 TaxID=3461147 RepID=UPI004044703A